MEEQFPSKEKVGGSNPPRGERAGSSVVERRPDKTEVVGSIPTLPTNNGDERLEMSSERKG
jgi:hypothetical protein